ncbi:putative quinol monooxygenase [Streptococcus caviae]|uniref:putative quinol monooxygenase n=1 Tax=Streptococcus sp. 'caviae' TaxID=1915004 RepID=UPI00094B8CFB|nr:putative quinol monooxygenase [Streptococcus sp. 'caviae']OLN84024.1 antibiotic biosynthesis monooxygenase [Streptococcus sp. 'caviae']
MKIINAVFFIKADKRQAFLADVAPLIESSRAENGNHAYQLYEAVDLPNQFVMVEEWENQAAIDQHNTNPHFLQLMEHLQDYSTADPVIKVAEQ